MVTLGLINNLIPTNWKSNKKNHPWFFNQTNTILSVQFLLHWLHLKIYISHWSCSNYLPLCISMCFIKWGTKKILVIRNSWSTPSWKWFKNKCKHYIKLFMYYKVEKINIRIKHVQHIKSIIKIGAKKKKDFS